MYVVIYGAGGHGREVADILQHQRRAGKDIEIRGFVDDDSDLHGSHIGGLPVLGGTDWFKDCSDVQAIIAVGRPRWMDRLAAEIARYGVPAATAISPSAHVSPRATVGDGTVIFPGAVVQNEVDIGEHVIMNVGASVSHDTVVRRCANINPGAHLAGNITVGEGAFVGMGASVLQGVTIGDWAVVGAGAVVLDDVPARATVVGVPARIVRHRASGDDET